MGIIVSVLDILLVPAAVVDTGWNESAMVLWIMRWALLENDGAKKKQLTSVEISVQGTRVLQKSAWEHAGSWFLYIT